MPAVTTNVTQASVLAAVKGGVVRVTGAHVKVAADIGISEFVRASQAHAKAAVKYAMVVDVTQAYVLIAVRGRVTDPKIRAWTYSLDGHDFYVLRLGNGETLVYDTLSEQWYVWGSTDDDLWRVFSGQNWIGGSYQADTFGSNVLVGDDGNGALYFLAPEEYYDDDALVGDATLRSYERVASAQLVISGYDAVPTDAVQLLGSIGEMDDATLTSVELLYSDDQGHTYTSAGAISIANAEYDKRVEWRSLGSVFAPGRLFKIVDSGALVRIDYLEVDDGRTAGPTS